MEIVVFFIVPIGSPRDAYLGKRGDYLGGPHSGLRSRVPGTLAVAGITGVVALIVLLFAGLLE